MRWTLHEIPWHEFDPAKVDAGILGIVKAASVVEANSAAYGDYLAGVFENDPEFRAFATQAWVEEERQHGLALGRWAALADPGFDPECGLGDFAARYALPSGKTGSVRGSPALELMSRCFVETGTSSFYAALADATDEPVLKNIAERIAKDEVHHYRRFLDAYRVYARQNPPGLRERLRLAFARARELGDDELGLAFHVTNHPDRPYDRERAFAEYSRVALGLYRRRHVDRMVGMLGTALGLPLPRILRDLVTFLATLFFRIKTRQYAARVAC